MKIVYANDVVYKYAIGDPSARGGAERYGWYLMKALAHAGWSVTVGAQFSLGEGETRIIDGVKFLGLTRRAHFLLDWYTFLRSERPDWCFYQCADHLWGPMAEIARQLGVRTAFSVMHDMDVQPRLALWHRKSWWRLYEWGLRRSDIIFVQHQGQRAFLPPSWQAKAYFLPGIVPLVGRYMPHDERRKTVAWVAVIRPPKRPDLLLEIAQRLPMVHFTVCGAPSLGHWDTRVIERLIAQLQSLPNVHYRGHVPPEEAIKVIGEASLLLSTSDGEGFPSVFLEAWAAGTPVVSMKIDPDSRIMECGLGKVAGSVAEAAEAVRSLMASPESCEAMGIKSRHHVEEVFSEASAVAGFEAAVREATKVP